MFRQFKLNCPGGFKFESVQKGWKMKSNFGCSKFSGSNINYNQFPSDASKFIYEMFSKQLDGVTNKTGKTREIQLKYL